MKEGSCLHTTVMLIGYGLLILVLVFLAYSSSGQHLMLYLR